MLDTWLGFMDLTTDAHGNEKVDSLDFKGTFTMILQGRRADVLQAMRDSLMKSGITIAGTA